MLCAIALLTAPGALAKDMDSIGGETSDRDPKEIYREQVRERGIRESWQRAQPASPDAHKETNKYKSLSPEKKAAVDKAIEMHRQILDILRRQRVAR
ncbi:MAG TPA: hypothetical protein VE153_29465 [Myxococcus sp.]|nr:hypothetical protein [Myxococcus sp.]